MHKFIEKFFTDADECTISDFLHNGYCIKDVDNFDLLEKMRSEVTRITCDFLKVSQSDSDSDFLNNVHKILKPADINSLRLHIFHELNNQKWLRPSYFFLGKSSLELIVGNELVMQNKVNLSIQMPHDTSSLLGIHSDIYSGESPFEVVQWVPLVDVFESKSMFILPYKQTMIAQKELTTLERPSMEEIYSRYKKDLVWLDIPFGKALLFNPNCYHGNAVNVTSTSRWSFNTRFKGLFSPYGSPEKNLGSFYRPITTRPASIFGVNYDEPSGFEKK